MMIPQQRLTSSEIDDRLRHIPDDVLENIEKDVTWNFDRIMLPWFERGLYWNDMPQKHRPSEAIGSELLTETIQWRELEEYMKYMQLDDINDIYRLLWMDSYPATDNFGNYLSLWQKSILSTMWVTKRTFDSTMITLWVNGTRNLTTKLDKNNDSPHYLRLQSL